MNSFDFDFHEYISQLSEDELLQFAIDSGTTVKYLKGHLIYKKKIPRPDAIESMVQESKGDFSKSQFIHWLYNLEVA